MLKHRVLPGESLQSIAVKHGGDLTTIKRLNSIISDNSLPARPCLFVPGGVIWKGYLHFELGGLLGEGGALEFLQCPPHTLT